jgi:hypothetical protein
MKNKLFILIATLSIFTMVTLSAENADNSATIVVEAPDSAFVFDLEEMETTGSWISADGREIYQAYENVRNGFSADFRIRATSGSYASAADLDVTVSAGPLTLEATGDTYTTPSISGTVGSSFNGTFSNGVFDLSITPNYVYGTTANSAADSLSLTFGFTSISNAPAGRYTCDITVEYEFV